MAALRSPTGGDAPTPPLRSIRAHNPSALTLDGTRTYLVGRRRVAVIDPGPAAHSHLDRIAAGVADAGVVTVLLTHRHPDHAAGAAALAARLEAPVRGLAEGTLAEGDRIDTDAGELVALATPGHTPDHVAFHWSAEDAVFCGDLMLGGRETALIAPPEGNLALYLDSLRRLADLRPAVIYPAHGEPFRDPAAAIELYVGHRRDRERQVLQALEEGPAGEEELVMRVYGAGLSTELLPAARAALPAYLEHLRAAGRIRVDGAGRWAVADRPGAAQ